MGDYYMPPEWVEQEAVWLSWPVDDPRHWGGGKREVIWEKFAEVAALISRFEEVRINAVPGLEDWLPERLARFDGDEERVALFDHAHNDVWCRDHGPLFVKHRETGEVAVTDWGFNGWGGQFYPWDLDDTVPAQVAESLGMKRIAGGMILEGGAIELNGEGQCLTTEAVLLNENRNPGLSQGEIAWELFEKLGVTEMLWLERGIEGDDTGGHVDDLARFVSDEVIVAAVDSGSSSPNGVVLADNRRRLGEMLTKSGKPFEIVEMPLPQACEVPGWRLPVLPASHVNYLLVNGAVLVPTFRQGGRDERALGIYRELFPGREVLGIDCLDLVEEGGALHCISQQQPK
jgi:agmatine deiminase